MNNMRDNNYGYIGEYNLEDDDDNSIFAPEVWGWSEYPSDFAYNVHKLTSKGSELLEEFLDDLRVGYDLCYGKLQGLAGRYTKSQMWEKLTSDRTLSVRMMKLDVWKDKVWQMAYEIIDGSIGDWIVKRYGRELVFMTWTKTAGQNIIAEVTMDDIDESNTSWGCVHDAITICKGVARDLNQIYINYDVDEEVRIWFGANRGEPTSVRTLLEDMDEAKRLYEELLKLVVNAKNTYARKYILK